MRRGLGWLVQQANNSHGGLRRCLPSRMPGRAGVTLPLRRVTTAQSAVPASLRLTRSRLAMVSRSHTCGELGEADAGKQVTLCGWLEHSRRISADIHFLTLRDAYGATQVVVTHPTLLSTVRQLRPESVIKVTGQAHCRPLGMCNPAMATGAVEVEADSICVLNTCQSLPFSLAAEKSKDNLPNEALRLRHRYVDLRRRMMQENLRLRSRVAHLTRSYLAEEHGFIEVETPTLFKRTPGGAAEFPVPTREPGLFYTLVQSPQQFKQLLMVGGLDRYYQFARCYRDESGRGDRQPEFTQIDLELSFVTQEEILTLIEGLVRRIWVSVLEKSLPISFPRISFHEAMRRFGSDKPDVRYGLELKDVSSAIAGSGQQAWAFRVEQGLLPSGKRFTRKDVDRLQEAAKTMLVPGMPAMQTLVIRVGDKLDWTSVAGLVARAVGAEENDLAVVTIGGQELAVLQHLGKLRTLAASLTEAHGAVLRRADQHCFLWVQDFPLFEKNEFGRLASSHHPFTAPLPQDAGLLTTQPLSVRAQHFDLVLNGVELGGGSVRIHNAEEQAYVLRDVLGEDLALFDQLLEGLRSGAPPHGGIALGFDRLMMVLCGAPSLRDVLAFPKSFSGKDLMAGVPGPLPAEELSLYHLSPSA